MPIEDNYEDESKNDQYHLEDYSKVCCEGAIGYVSGFLHRSLERSGSAPRRNRLLKRSDLFEVLEVGAGAGQHAEYVKHLFGSLTQCDIRPQNIPDIASDSRITKLCDSIDAEELPFADSCYDRLIATCLLAHLTFPEKALSEWKRVVRQGGVISIYVPCEPGILLRFFQSITTRRKQKSFGYDARLLHYREHKNHYPGMMTLIHHVFDSNVSTTNYPFPFLGWNFNLWTIVQIESLNK